MTDDSHYPPFLGSVLAPVAPAEALFHIIPAPFEASVSYGTGTAQGPLELLKASWYLELYDGYGVPAEEGIHTQPPLTCQGSAPEVLAAIGRRVSEVLALGKLPVMLGGEHTVTVGAIEALVASGQKFGVVQFDAHADLRDSYQGTPYSHGCVMRRIFDLQVPIYQLGVRSLSPEEVAFRREQRVGYLDAVAIAAGADLANFLPPDFPDKIYLTFDVDCLDPALMPATGTPEPGGPTWFQVMTMLESVVRGRQVVGVDLVELAPIPGQHAPNFAAARLLYNLFGIITRLGKF